MQIAYGFVNAHTYLSRIAHSDSFSSIKEYDYN